MKEGVGEVRERERRDIHDKCKHNDAPTKDRRREEWTKYASFKCSFYVWRANIQTQRLTGIVRFRLHSHELLGVGTVL